MVAPDKSSRHAPPCRPASENVRLPGHDTRSEPAASTLVGRINTVASTWSRSRLLVVPATGLMVLFALVARGAAAVDFNRDIAPILARRCLECHSATEQAGGLILTHAEALLDGGDSGVVLVAASSGLFFVALGFVQTDMALTLGVTACMAGFYGGLQGDRRWGWLFFLGLAIGLLAKGPVATVLSVMPITAWMIWRGNR